MEKLKMHSPNLTQENIRRIMALFPNCVTEVRATTESTEKDNSNHSEFSAPSVVKYAIDFDLLRQELSESIVEGPQERYHLNWPGKREALLTANAPIAKTLRPCREESVDFDTTKNLFIEGDNLDALKLLQETYLGKVKMIYIDPPYNTGNDFIYEDDFAENAEEFLKRSNQKDEEGNRLVANTEANGRFHSDWLSMMYSRLKLARHLLRDDGIIFVSIDDDEASNLCKICNEIFGESNFIANLVWDRNRKNDAKYFSVGHEYMAVYFKDKSFVQSQGTLFRAPKDGVDELKNFFNKLRADFKDDWDAIREKILDFYLSIPEEDPREPIKRFRKFDHKGPYRDDGNINWPGGGGPMYQVIHPGTKRPCKLPASGWRYPTPQRFWEEFDKGRVVFGPDESTVPKVRTNLFENNDQVMKSVHYSYAQTATNKFIEIFDGIRVFENPKPASDIVQIVRYVTDLDDIVVDFFAGSATTAHAVMQLNAEDGGNRKFIMVQLPEPCDEKSEAFKAGYKTIAEISKERIRRAGKKILEKLTTENTERHGKSKNKFSGEADSSVSSVPSVVKNPDIGFLEGLTTESTEKQGKGEDDSFSSSSVNSVPSVVKNLDIGFRVLKVDSSNMADVYYMPDAIEQNQLEVFIDNIKPDRTPEDLLFQVLLDWGVDLTLPIRKESVTTERHGKGEDDLSDSSSVNSVSSVVKKSFEVFFVDDNALIACFDDDITEELVKELAQFKPLRVVFCDTRYQSDNDKINVTQIFKQLSPGTEVKAI